jgi:hypothetical protein
MGSNGRRTDRRAPREFWLPLHADLPRTLGAAGINGKNINKPSYHPGPSGPGRCTNH